MVVGLILGSASGAFGLSGRPNISSEYLKLSQNTVGTYPGGVKWLCSSDDISLSPRAGFVVINRSSMSKTSLVSAARRLILGDLACLDKHGLTDACLLTIEGLDGARVASWSSDDDHLFIVENSKSVADFKLTHGKNPSIAFVERVSIGESLGKTITVLGSSPAIPVAAEVLRWRKKLPILSQSPGNPVIVSLKSIVAPKFGEILYFNPQNLGVSVAQIKGDVPVSRAFLQQGDLTIDTNGDGLISDVGWRFKSRSGVWSSESIAPFTRSIISSRTGNIIGSYSLDTVSLSGGSTRSVAAQYELRSEITARPASVLWRVSADEQGNYAAVFKDTAGTPSFVAFADGHHVRLTCPSNGTAFTRVKTRIVSLGSAQRPLGLIEEIPPEPKGIAVFFQGGPASNIAEVVDQPLPQFYLSRNWAVLAVGYSGSAGLGIQTSSRLKSDGPASLHADAAIVLGYLNRAYPKLPVISHGESFGGAPAVALDAMLGGRKGALIAIAPYLKSRPPAEWLSTTGFFSGNLAYQESWENSVMGLRDEAARASFNRGLISLANGRSGSRAAVFFFGRPDKASIAADIPPEYRRNAEIVQLDSIHQLITSEQKIYSKLDEIISDLSN
jgi:hypothetical protein